MSEKIGFIGGGQMGEALIKGILAAGTYQKNAIIVAEPDSARRSYLESEYSITTSETAKQIWQDCTIVVLAVKPQIMGAVLADSQSLIQENHLLITIAAGLPISYYKEHINIDQCKIIRVMPNTPALVMEGASALCGSKEVNEADLDKAVKILDGIGKTVVLDEHYMDAVTGLSGSGPAYVFTFIEAMIDAGVQNGLTRDTAEMLTIQTVLGSVKLLQATKEHPAVLRSRVTSPGGTTIAGLHVLEKKGFRGIIMAAIKAATQRSHELGNK